MCTLSIPVHITRTLYGIMDPVYDPPFAGEKCMEDPWTNNDVSARPLSVVTALFDNTPHQVTDLVLATPYPSYEDKSSNIYQISSYW